MSKHEAEQLSIRPMTRAELDVLVEWAAAEGWNPGIHDAEHFWQTDPRGFIAAELDGELVGGGAIVCYGHRFGFMGLFIVRPDLRGRGFGDRLWHERKRLLLARLKEPKLIGMDGVFAMQDYYGRGGFSFYCRDLRFEGRGKDLPPCANVVDLDQFAFSEVDAYDRRHFPVPREAFLDRWIKAPGGAAVGVRRDGGLAGFAVLRPCLVGYKIGPLFADDAELAELLYAELSRRVSGEAIFLDVPENNPDALALAAAHEMREIFGCARMYLGPVPRLADPEIFGVTTFELG